MYFKFKSITWIESDLKKNFMDILSWENPTQDEWEKIKQIIMIT